MAGGIAEYIDGLATEMSRRDDVHVCAYGTPEIDTDAFPYEVTYVSQTDRKLGECLGDNISILRRFNSFLWKWGTLRRESERVISTLCDKYSHRKTQIYLCLWSPAAHWWCRWLRESDLDYHLFSHGLEILPKENPLRERQLRTDFRGASTVFANSQATAALARQRFGLDNTCVAYPGVSSPEFEREDIDEKARELRSRLSIDKTTPILLTIGRLVERKGVHKVLSAVASSPLKDLDFRYLVAGDGPRAPHLQKLAERLGVQNRVDFLGYVDDLTKWGLYKLADLFVMPNSSLDGEDWEGFGIVFLEAALMHVPSIGGKSGGATEAILDGDTGLVVNPDNPEELRDKLCELLSRPGERTRLGERAHERATEQFTWKHTADRVLAATQADA